MGEDREWQEGRMEDPDLGAGPSRERCRSPSRRDRDREASSPPDSCEAAVRLRPLAGPRHREPEPRADDQPEPAAADGDDFQSLHKFSHRAGWLVLLLMCQSTSSLILEHFELLIRHHPVVIYFLTMLVGAGGNAGSQSTVLVVRQLALVFARGGKGGQDDPRFSVRSIVGQEVSVGAQLAIVLFFATFLRCLVFNVRGLECLAICLSMLAIVFSSTLIGAALPLLLNRLRVDPAHAGATIQVIMDISGVSLTCVVSCVVLGLPISGVEHDMALAAVRNATAATHALAHPAALRGAQVGIQAHSVSSGLNGFGKTEY